MSSKRFDFGRLSGFLRAVLVAWALALGAGLSFAATLTIKNQGSSSVSWEVDRNPSPMRASGTIAAGSETTVEMTTWGDSSIILYLPGHGSSIALPTGTRVVICVPTGTATDCTSSYPLTSYTNYTATASYLNNGYISLNVGLYLTNVGGTVSFQTNQVASPGEGVQSSISTGTNAWTGWAYLWTNWDGNILTLSNGVPALVTTNVVLPTVVTPSVSDGGILTNALIALPPSLLPSVTAPIARSNDTSSVTAAISSEDKNSDARNKELIQVIDGLATIEGKGAEAVVKGAAANAVYLQQILNQDFSVQNTIINNAAGQAHTDAASTASAVNAAGSQAHSDNGALLSAISTLQAQQASGFGGLSNELAAPTGSTTNVPGSLTGFGLGTNAAPAAASSLLSSFLGESTTFSGDDGLAFVIPLGSLEVSGLDDQTISLKDPELHLDTVGASVRAIILVIVTVSFFFMTLRLVGKLAF